jgi:enamine deaminase RidA (YjgF/YER057c/UK114 family)
MSGQIIETAEHLSGIVGNDPRAAGVANLEQTRAAVTNREAILCAAGTWLSNVAEVYVPLARPGDFPRMNDAYAKFPPSGPPASAC